MKQNKIVPFENPTLKKLSSSFLTKRNLKNHIILKKEVEEWRDLNEIFKILSTEMEKLENKNGSIPAYFSLSKTKIFAYCPPVINKK